MIQINKSDIAAAISLGKTKADTARDLGVSVKTLNQRIKKLGMFFPRAKRRASSRVADDVSAVTEFVIEHGGSIEKAREQLNITTSTTTIRKHLKKRGIDLKPFRHTGRTFGSWKVLPSPFNSAGGDTFLCECQICGTVKEVLRHSLANKRSRSCMKCASHLRKASNVVDTLGQSDFNSISAFVRAFDLVEHYQSIRLKLKQGKTVSVGGREFVLENQL